MHTATFQECLMTRTVYNVLHVADVRKIQSSNDYYGRTSDVYTIVHGCGFGMALIIKTDSTAFLQVQLSSIVGTQIFFSYIYFFIFCQ